MRYGTDTGGRSVAFVRLFAGAALLVAGNFCLQDSAGQDDTFFVVELTTNAPQASVYVDDALVGRASQRFLRLPDGSQRLKLVLAGKDNWSIPPVSTVFEQPAAGDTVSVHLDFPYRYRFESTPYGATVYMGEGGGLLGRTPLETQFDLPIESSVTFELEGYWPEEIAPGEELWNIHAVRMRPVDTNADASPRIAWNPPKKRKKWIDYAALGTAAVARVVAR
ncbi:MAG: hypothetical protein R3282_10590, partial [Rhodothermales bacterium]|nr:hypothetical protein [Rhodothermales bacterium]